MLTSITENIRSLLDQGQYVCGIFLDHEILCENLNHYGVHGNVNKLIKYYLVNRKQYVSLNGFDSEKQNIDCNVPQGSSLGPLLFLIYINNFRLCLNETKSGHFADF